MIRIVQISKQDADPLGLRTYEIGINNHPAIATFKHRRGDGLAVCLRKASEAVGATELNRVQQIMGLLP